MNFHLSITDGPEFRTDQIVVLDPAKFLITTDETPLDIVLGLLARAGRMTSRDAMLTHLAIPNGGIKTWAAIVLPGGIQRTALPEGFDYPFEARVHIDLHEETIEAPGYGVVPLAQGFAMMPDRYDLYDLGKHREKREKDAGGPFRRIHVREGLDPGDLITASFAAGICRAAIDHAVLLRTGHARLAGVALGLDHQALAERFETRFDHREGASGVPSHWNHFWDTGILRSDRAFLPTRPIPSPRFADIEAMADPDLYAAGQRAGTILARASEAECWRAMRILIDLVGEDPVQFHIEWHHPKAESAHEITGARMLIQRLAEAIGLQAVEELRHPARLGRNRRIA